MKKFVRKHRRLVWWVVPLQWLRLFAAVMAGQYAASDTGR